jgi:hypothetical protein
VLWSYPPDVREVVSGRALAKLLRRRIPLRERVEGAAHKYVNLVMRREAMRAGPRPRRPPQPPPKPGREDPFEHLRAGEDEIALLFDKVVPTLFDLYRQHEARHLRAKLLSRETLEVSLTQLREMALGYARPIPDGARRTPDRKRYQRVAKALRIFLPRAWKRLRWCPEDVAWPSRSLKSMRETLMEVAADTRVAPEVLQTFKALVSLTEAFHVERRGRKAPRE